MNEHGATRHLAAVVVADVVGYSRLVGADEIGTVAAVNRRWESILKPIVNANGGRVVKFMGDGVLMEFPSAVAAMHAALALQRGMVEANRSNGAPAIQLRIGMNLGDVISEGGDIFGDDVNIASRLEALSRPGELCISRSVHDAVRGKLQFEAVDLGEVDLRNIAKPVRAFRIHDGTADWSDANSSPVSNGKPVAATEPSARNIPERGHSPSVIAPKSGVASQGTPAADRPSIAVLPFETAGQDQEWVSDGIAEDITTALAKSRRLRVVSRNYSFAFKGRAIRGDEIARQLHVQYLLEGSVRLSGNNMRVSTRLIEGETGELLWAERFDREFANVFAIQDEITDAVARRLELELLPEERQAIQQSRTANIEAYHHELRGRQLTLALTKTNLVLARRMFGRAAELDPGYARAYAGMAICACYLRDWHGYKVLPEEILPIADRAVTLDPSLPEAHTARGFALFCNEQYEEAESEYRQALAIDPNSYEANFFFASTIVRFRNDRQRMVSLLKLAARLRPDDYVSPLMIAGFGGDNGPERLEWARICVERAERAVNTHPENASPLHRGALAFAYLGDRARALSWIDRALALEPDEFIARVNAAGVYATLGEVERALDQLEKAARDVPQNTIDMLRGDADFDAIRIHPRFSIVLQPRRS